jgi:PKD repeat protein
MKRILLLSTAFILCYHRGLSQQICQSNLLQNGNFSIGTANWQAFSGALTSTVPNTISCLSTFIKLRAFNTPPKGGDGIEQQVKIDSGKCYNVCACIGPSFPSHNVVQFWALRSNPTLTYDSLINNSFPPGDAALIGTVTVSGAISPQTYCINGWYAPDSFSRLVIFNSTDSLNASIDIDNICMEQTPVCAACTQANISTSFTYNVITGTTTQFNNTSTVGSGSVIAYQWNFGDAANSPNDTSTLPNPIYTFSAPGTYFVCLKVTVSTSAGVLCKDSFCMDVVVPPAPPCDTTGNGFTFVQSGDTAWFSGTTGSVAVSWQWNFGDPASGPNNQSTLQNPMHIFSGSGIYNVCLIITFVGTDGTLCYDTICKTVNVVKPSVNDDEWNQLKVFPNPCDYALHLNNLQSGSITIWSLEGKFLKQEDVSPFATIAVKQLADGCYCLRYSTEKGYGKNLRFFVRH